MNETEIKNQIIKYLETSGCIVKRLQSGRVRNNVHGNKKGTLDYIVVNRTGFIYWLETKGPDGELSNKQKEEIAELRRRKQRVVIAADVHDVKHVP